MLSCQCALDCCKVTIVLHKPHSPSHSPATVLQVHRYIVCCAHLLNCFVDLSPRQSCPGWLFTCRVRLRPHMSVHPNITRTYRKAIPPTTTALNFTGVCYSNHDNMLQRTTV